MKQCFDDDVTRRERRRVTAGRPCARGGTAGLHGNDRFLSGYATCDLGKAPRVAERLEVQSDYPRRGIVGPVLEEIVPGHIRLVAYADEGGEANMSPCRQIEDHESERAAL
jgi:hypothetical protein